MTPSSKLVSLLKQWEGFKNKPYKDVAGLLTIGVGHLLTSKEKTTKVLQISDIEVNWENGLTDKQVDDLLLQDLKPFTNAINSLVKVSLTQDQFDALVSFVFNVGISAFKSSTLLKRLNDSEYLIVPLELLKWNKAGGKVVQGLVNRRNNELKLWRGSI